MVELSGELGMAEQETQRGAQVVELFWRQALGLSVAGGVEGGVFAVEQEEFAGGRVVGPAHAAGLAQGEGAGFAAVYSRSAHTLVALGVAGAEGLQMVVVRVDGVREGGGGGSLPGTASILR